MSKKKSIQYLYEFLIVFIAVFLGFLADNFRESLADQAKEKQYAIGLLKDLRSDSVGLTEVIAANKTKLPYLDSLAWMHKADLRDPANARRFFHCLIKSKMYTIDFFRSNETTSSQLRSTGDLRLMQKNEIANSISDYVSSIEYLKEKEILVRAHKEEAWRMTYHIADYISVISNFGQITSNDKTYKPVQLTGTNAEMQVYFNLVIDLKFTIAYFLIPLEQQLVMNSKLIKQLRNGYQIN